jgi:hypothetical protein
LVAGVSGATATTYSEAEYATNTTRIGAIESRLTKVGFTGRIIYPVDFDNYEAIKQYHGFVARDIIAYKRHFKCDPQIDYLFIDSDTANALCTCIDGRYLIVISVILIDTLWSFTLLIIAIGKCDNIFDHESLCQHIVHLNAGGGIAGDYSTKSQDDNIKLQQLAVFITRLSMIFVICHEMAHIINGHLALDKDNIDSILESSENVRDPNNILRSMENDADLFSIYQLIGLVTEQQSSMFENGMITDIETDSTRRIKCAIVGIFVCLNLFDCFRPTNIETATTHPSHYDRTFFAESFVSACLSAMLIQKCSTAEISRNDLFALMFFVRSATKRIGKRALDFETLEESIEKGAFSAETQQRYSAWRALGVALQSHQMCDPVLAKKIRNIYEHQD